MAWFLAIPLAAAGYYYFTRKPPTVTFPNYNQELFREMSSTVLLETTVEISRAPYVSVKFDHPKISMHVKSDIINSLLYLMKTKTNHDIMLNCRNLIIEYHGVKLLHLLQPQINEFEYNLCAWVRIYQ